MAKFGNRVCVITLSLFILFIVYQPLKLYLQVKVSQFNIWEIQPSPQTTKKIYEEETKSYLKSYNITKSPSLPKHQIIKKINENENKAKPLPTQQIIKNKNENKTPPLPTYHKMEKINEKKTPPLPKHQIIKKINENKTATEYQRTFNISTTQPSQQTTQEIQQEERKPYLKHPLDIDMVELLNNIRNGKRVNQKKINVHNFTYIQHPSKRCTLCSMNNTDGNLSNVLILVKSQPNNFHFRISMRRVLHRKTSVCIFFLIGYSTSFNIALKKENTMYDDIIQMDFQDSYRNLTFKTMMGYKWATQFCPGAEYVLFQDDDFYINVDNLIKFLQQQEDPERVFVGHLIKSSKFIYRNPRHKWYLSKSDYPFDVLPPYFPGGVYVVSMYLTNMLTLVLPYVKRIPIDDVYIGIVASKLNISLTNSELFRFDKCVNTDKIIACNNYLTIKEILDSWKQSMINLFLKDSSSGLPTP